MLPLASSAFPASHEALSQSISLGFQQYGVTPRQLQIDGGLFPEVKIMRIDLSGSKVTREHGMAAAGGTTISGPERLHIDQVELNATPIEFEGMPLAFQLHATGAKFAPAGGAGSRAFLIPITAATGELLVSAQRTELEKLAHSLVAAAASKQGIEIKKTRLELHSTSARSLDFRAEVTAKMFIMSATLTVSGKLEVDDQLNARVSGLSCRGDGMIASAANAFLKPHFQRIESQPFSLNAFSLGELQLRDISLQTGETVQLRGVFGSEPAKLAA